MKKTKPRQFGDLGKLPAVLIEKIPSGVKNFDKILGGGVVKGAITVLAGSPGAGKTTLAQQICFNNANSKEKAIIFQTLSEPAAKTMRYMGQYGFFAPHKVNESVEYVDLGSVLRSKGMDAASAKMLDHIKRVQPAYVLIDSFKVFEDFADDREQLRKFTYDIAVQLMAWEITGFLLGEYAERDIESSPLFSVVDGIISLKACDLECGGDRTIRVVKMRGADHKRLPHVFSIVKNGVEVGAIAKRSK